MNSDLINQEEALEQPDVTEETEIDETEPETEIDEAETVEEAQIEESETVPEDNTPSEAENYLNTLIREERISNEYAEFKSLFPGVSVSELPDSVISSIKNGVPLSAAYALYERRRAMSASAASGVNKKNRELSFAVKSGKSSEVYFSPNEVRQMSPSEVKTNYSKILDSMSHWN